MVQNMKTEKRSEIKYVFNNKELNNFISSYNLDEALYPDRLISSIYFDTINFDLYKNCLFQDSDNYKVRIRYYNNNLAKLSKEVKYTKPNGKSKSIKKLDLNSELPSTVIFKNQLLKQASKVEYKRQYYKFNNSRITIDTNIHYMSVNYRTYVTKNINENLNIVEFKLLKENNFEIFNDLPSSPTSYSKFKQSIKKLYNIY